MWSFVLLLCGEDELVEDVKLSLVWNVGDFRVLRIVMIFIFFCLEVDCRAFVINGYSRVLFLIVNLNMM